jgi:hypothetical protein
MTPLQEGWIALALAILALSSFPGGSLQTLHQIASGKGTRAKLLLPLFSLVFFQRARSFGFFPQIALIWPRLLEHPLCTYMARKSCFST